MPAVEPQCVSTLQPATGMPPSAPSAASPPKTTRHQADSHGQTAECCYCPCACAPVSSWHPAHHTATLPLPGFAHAQQASSMQHSLFKVTSRPSEDQLLGLSSAS